MNRRMKEDSPIAPQTPRNADPKRDAAGKTADACGTNLFCPVCGHEFLPEEIGKKPHCRRCGYLESCCNPE